MQNCIKCIKGKNLKIVFKIEIPALRSIIYSLRNESYEKPNHGLKEKNDRDVKTEFFVYKKMLTSIRSHKMLELRNNSILSILCYAHF